MLRSRIVLLGIVAALSAGAGAAYGKAQPVKKQPAPKVHGFVPNLHYPCHSPGAHISPARV